MTIKTVFANSLLKGMSPKLTIYLIIFTFFLLYHFILPKFPIDKGVVFAATPVFKSYEPEKEDIPKYFLGFGFDVNTPNVVDSKKWGYWYIWEDSRVVNITPTTVDIENKTIDEGIIQNVPEGGFFNLKNTDNNEFYTFKVKKIFWDTGVVIQPLNKSFYFKDFTDPNKGKGKVNVITYPPNDYAAMTSNNSAIWISDFSWSDEYRTLVKAAIASRVKEWFATGKGEISWWDLNWQYRRKLTFDNSAQNEDLNDFPVLIKLDSSFDYSNTKLDGTDLRFIDSDDTTVLNYHIEKWDSGGESFVWVKVPNIPANSNTDYMWMYYNNPDASDAQDESNTYDSNFVGIWNFNESSGTITYDSTQYNNDGVFYGETFYDGTFGNGTAGTEPTWKSGIDCRYGSCLEFEGTPNVAADVISVSDIPNTSLTVMAWIYPKQILGDQRAIVSKWRGGTSEWLFRLSNHTIARLEFHITNTTNDYEWTWANAYNIQLNEWTHVAVVYEISTGQVDFYRNGTLVPANRQIGSTRDGSSIVRIGAQGGPTFDPFNGTIDEIRIYDRTLSQTEIQEEMQSSLPVERSVASWSFEEGSGTIVNDTHIWVKGKYGSGLNFDGANDEVVISDSSSFDITDELTVCAWVYPSSTQSSGGSNQIIQRLKWNGGGDRRGFFLREGSIGSHVPQFWVANGTDWTYASAGTVTPERWYHIAGTVKANDKIRIYIDGDPKQEKDFIGNIVQYTGNIKIGREGTGTKAFNGTIDEVRIWDRALTQAEILEEIQGS